MVSKNRYKINYMQPYLLSKKPKYHLQKSEQRK